MINIGRLFELGIEIQHANLGVNSFKMTQDESEVVANLQSHKVTDNHLLVIMIPSMDSKKSDSVDNIQFRNLMQFLVLEKRDPKLPKNNQEDMFIYKRTQETLNNILEYFFQHFGDDDSNCEMFRKLDVSSFEIDPVKGVSDCFGWSWSFNF
ncbi:hypothetical protein ACTS9K_08440 [Empedobacter sp. ULE_I145]